jgi:hypothetical protein
MNATSKAEAFQSPYEAGLSRKRKRTLDAHPSAYEEEDDDADDAEFDDGELGDGQERKEANKKIKVESDEHDTHSRENRKLKDENGLLRRTLRETEALLLERSRALMASQQRIAELERRLGAHSGCLMTAPPHP